MKDGANTDLIYLFRTAEIALLGDNRVLDSPRVGSILVYRGRIIGEGYHRQAGQAHAEVNCLNSVKTKDRHLVPLSVLYVSLEPCCIVGKTGACSTLILNSGIKTVVIAQRDSTPGVAGNSVELLRAAGVEVREYPDFEPTMIARQYRETLVLKGRPHVTLKYATSSDGFLRPADRSASYWITNAISRRLVHRWRASTTAIIVGASTVVDDDPSLTTRFWPGPHARPVVVDPKGRLTGKERVFHGPASPILFSSRRVELAQSEFIEMPSDLSASTIRRILSALAERRLANITVEGGAALLKAFLASGCWDEAWVFTGAQSFGAGLLAPWPESFGGQLIKKERIGSDGLATYEPS